jgi:hypothetical protein
MRTIETTAVVTADHTLTVAVPTDIPAGPCRVVVVVEQPSAAATRTKWADLPTYDVVLTDPTCTFRREDLYGDGDR